MLVVTGSAAAMMLVNNPIPGIDIIVRKEPGGTAIKVKTDDKGGFALNAVEPGTYRVTLGGPSLRRGVQLLNRTDSDPPKAHRSSASQAGSKAPQRWSLEEPVPVLKSSHTAPHSDRWVPDFGHARRSQCHDQSRQCAALCAIGEACF
jgi:hypothetical protein